MTLKEFKALVNNSYEVYTPTDDTDYDVYALRTNETYKIVEKLEEDAYLDNEIVYFEADTTADDDCIFRMNKKEYNKPLYTQRPRNGAKPQTPIFT